MKFFHKAIKKGFTLVELVIVIAVIAVLAAVLIPVFSNVIKDAKISKTKANLNTCSNTLIMYAQYNDIDYYTPQNIKEFLLAEGIDINEPVLDGYSIWYNQRNFNLMLIKNDELADYVNGSSVSAYHNGAVVAYAEEVGASSALDNLPRRIEAITPNEDLLLMATDKENIGLIGLIDSLYTLGDSGEMSNMYTKLNNTLQNMRDYSLLNTSGDSFTDYYNSYTFSDGSKRNFSVAWLNNEGDWVVCAPTLSDVNTPYGEDESTYFIKKTIISPNIGDSVASAADLGAASSVYGNIKVDGREVDGGKLLIDCTTEIAAAKYEIKFENSFYENIVESGANIVVSGKIDLSTGSSSYSSASNVSVANTATGIAGQISTAVNNGTGQVSTTTSGTRFVRDTMTSTEYKAWTSEKIYYTDKDGNNVETSLINVSNATVVSESEGSTPATYKVSVTQPNGQVKYVEVDDSYFNTPIYTYTDSEGQKQISVPYKYNVPRIVLSVKALMSKEGVENKDDIYELNVSQETFNGVTSTTIYMRYKKGDIIVGKTYRLGVGYISSFDHYYSYYNDTVDYSKGGFYENFVPKYNKLSGEEAVSSASAGDIGIKLPSDVDSLQAYKKDDETGKRNFTIEVYYNNGTSYYKHNKSELGNEYITELNTVWNNEENTLVLSNSTWSEDTKNKIIYGNFGTFDKIGELVDGNATDIPLYYSFVNKVKINRIIIKDSSGNILIAKYPD
ncbi:MAG: type II secretion system protein [Clostridia bacterium]|nr:type II secretion system protein [Clostridia bacterium]